MQTAPRAYRAICFDLDGTLLPMDLDEFMASYFKRIARFAAKSGLDPEHFMGALKLGTQAMAAHEDDATNEEAFWRRFSEVYGPGAREVRALVDAFYEDDFAQIGEGFEANPAVARVLGALERKGYPLVLLTMPMFPRRAVEHRLEWAGTSAKAFARITSYENSKAVKPRQTYYAENLAAMGLRGDDVLMIGNNTQEDLAFLDLGADAYLITDYLLDPVGFDLDAVRHGSMTDFEAWVEALEPCANPACGIGTGVVERARMEEAFAENAVRAIDRAASAAAAEAVAHSVTGEHIGADAGANAGAGAGARADAPAEAAEAVRDGVAAASGAGANAGATSSAAKE